MKKKTKKRLIYMLVIAGYVIPLVVFFSAVIPVFIANAKY